MSMMILIVSGLVDKFYEQSRVGLICTWWLGVTYIFMMTFFQFSSLIFVVCFWVFIGAGWEYLLLVLPWDGFVCLTAYLQSSLMLAPEKKCQNVWYRCYLNLGSLVYGMSLSSHSIMFFFFDFWSLFSQHYFIVFTIFQLLCWFPRWWSVFQTQAMSCVNNDRFSSSQFVLNVAWLQILIVTFLFYLKLWN